MLQVLQGRYTHNNHTLDSHCSLGRGISTQVTTEDRLDSKNQKENTDNSVAPARDPDTLSGGPNEQINSPLQLQQGRGAKKKARRKDAA
jgi:hypothetical protein